MMQSHKHASRSEAFCRACRLAQQTAARRAGMAKKDNGKPSLLKRMQTSSIIATGVKASHQPVEHTAALTSRAML